MKSIISFHVMTSEPFICHNMEEDIFKEICHHIEFTSTNMVRIPLHIVKDFFNMHFSSFTVVCSESLPFNRAHNLYDSSYYLDTDVWSIHDGLETCNMLPKIIHDSGSSHSHPTDNILDKVLGRTSHGKCWSYRTTRDNDTTSVISESSPLYFEEAESMS